MTDPASPPTQQEPTPVQVSAKTNRKLYEAWKAKVARCEHCGQNVDLAGRLSVLVTQAMAREMGHPPEFWSGDE